MSGVRKPQREEGMICPMFRKDVSEVCHKCEWFQSQLVTKPSAPGEPFEHWACALNMFVVVGRDMGAAVNGLQVATEGFRNEMSTQSKVQHAATQKMQEHSQNLVGAVLEMLTENENRLNAIASRNGQIHRLEHHKEDDS